MGTTALSSPARLPALLAVVAGLITLAVLRLLLIHYNMPAVFYWEEPYRLTIATEILSGPRLPLWEYQADHYQGGSLVVGMLAVPFVALFGASLETLKLVPLAITLATGALWCTLLWRAVGPGAAALFAWLLALPPPMAQIYQVHAMGSHADSALFTAAGFFLVREIAAGRQSRALPFLLGMVGGLGLWFCYSAASGIAVWGLFWLACSPRGSIRRGFVPLAAGTLAGLAPWIVYNLRQGFRGLDRLVELLDASQPEITASAEPLGTRLAALFGVDLARSLGFPEIMPGVPDYAAWIYFAVLLAALLTLGAIAGIGLWRRSRADEDSLSDTGLLSLLIFATVVVHLAIYAVSSFRLDVEGGFIAYRFFSPLFPLGAAAVAIVATHAAGRDARAQLRVVASAVIVIALGLGGYGGIALLREQAGEVAHRVESGYRLVGLLNHIKYRDDLPRAVEIVARFSGEERALAFFGYGWGLQFEYLKYPRWPDFAAGLSLVERASDHEAALRGARWSVAQRLRTSRNNSNAGFRGEVHRHAYVRQSELAALLKQLPGGG